MNTYSKSSKLNDVRYDVRGPNLVEAIKMEAAGASIVRLNIGNPGPFGFDTPPFILEAVTDHLNDSVGYSESQGITPAREAVFDYYRGKGYDLAYENVFIGNGASELITICLNALLEEGDEVLVPAPDYPLWTGQVTMSGGRAVHYLCDEDNEWNPDLDDIRSKITDHTKALVMINPNNPTGAVYSREIIDGFCQIAREHGLVLFSDEIYEKITYNEHTHVPTAPVAGHDVLCVTFSGLSKAYKICGYRVGWMVVTGPVAQAASLMEGITLLANMRLCPNVPGQWAIAPALANPQYVAKMCAPGGRFYEQSQRSRELLAQIPGVSCTEGKGALYLFPRLDPERYPIADDEAWARELLQSKHILVSHGTGFNWPKPDHFRLVALPRLEELERAIAGIGEFLAERYPE